MVGLVIVFVVLVLAFLAGLAWFRWRETKFLKKSAKETMGRELRTEIEKERLDALRRKKSFDAKLKKHGY